MGERELIVRKIKDGTVIDHIPAGTALTVLRILGITGREGFRVAVVMNVESRKLGKKDIVKIENVELDKESVDKIAIVAPTATINIVRNYKVVKKFKVSPPKELVGVAKCTNPKCISNKRNEPIKSRLKLVSTNPPMYVCAYCGRYVYIEDILKQFMRW